MIRSIEGLRGVAALMVVFFHAFVLARWGGAPAQWGLVQNAWLFVDLFFVISGAIMAMVYGQRLQDGRQVRAFFIKRFFRLYPLHLVTTLTAIGAVIVVQGAKWAAAQAGVQLGGEQPFAVEFFKLSYFLLELVMLQGVGIMTEALHNYPSWSLSVEFWLYLAFAVLFFFVRSTRARVWASAAIVVLCLDHFLRVFSGLGPQVLAPDVHGMPRGLLSFFIGVLVWYGWQAVQTRLRNLSSPVLGACQLVLAVLSLALIDMRADLGTWVYAIPFVFGLWVWSLLPQHQLVPEGITVRTLVGYGRSPYLNLWGSLGKADREIVDRVMAATHTDIIADRRVDQLSGGQQQRAFLAMTLAQETPYLLLDEPTTYLDLNHQVALMEMMAQQRDRGATVVAVLHDLNQAARYCDHLIVLKEGELMGEGSPKEVLTAEMLAKVFKVDAAQHICPESGRPMVVVKDSGLTEQAVTLPDPGWKKEEAA